MNWYPNQECIDYCNWLLEQTIYRLTPSQKNVLNYVITQAEAQEPLTVTQAKNFFNFTVQYYQPYIMYQRFFMLSGAFDESVFDNALFT